MTIAEVTDQIQLCDSNFLRQIEGFFIEKPR